MTYTRDLENSLRKALGEIKRMQEVITWYKHKNLQWQDKYDSEKEQFQKDMKYLDDRCAALENGSVLEEMTTELDSVKVRLEKFEKLAREFVDNISPDTVCQMRFEMLLYGDEEGFSDEC